MPDYTRGKIYKIISDKANLCYIGSTSEKYLSNRMSKHRTKFKLFKNSKSKNYYTSFKVLENDDAKIILIESFPCNSKYELEARERYWIENLECCNKHIPTRTKKEYYKVYNQRPERKAYMKEFRSRPESKAYMKEYGSRPARKAYMKEYDSRRKAYRSEKITCEFCGKQHRRGNKSTHQKTKYCLSFQQAKTQRT